MAKELLKLRNKKKTEKRTEFCETEKSKKKMKTIEKMKMIFLSASRREHLLKWGIEDIPQLVHGHCWPGAAFSCAMQQQYYYPPLALGASQVVRARMTIWGRGWTSQHDKPVQSGPEQQFSPAGGGGGGNFGG